MVEKKFTGRTIDAETPARMNLKDRGRIITAVENLQKEIRLGGYVVCPKCASGIHGDPKRTDPSYVANFCTGDCDILGLDEPKKYAHLNCKKFNNLLRRIRIKVKML